MSVETLTQWLTYRTLGGRKGLPEWLAFWGAVVADWNPA